MRILYVSQYFPPEMGAPAARVHELSREWVRLGHEVTVLTAFAHHPIGVKARRDRGVLTRREWVDGIRLIRTYVYAAANKGRIKRVASYASFMLSAATIGRLRIPRPDVVVATSPQLLCAAAGWFLARTWRAPFVFEVRDLWPETLQAIDMAKGEGAFFRALRHLSHFLYHHCEHLVTVGEGYARGIQTRYHVLPDKISVIPNGVDARLFVPGPQQGGLRDELGWSNKFVVLYLGTLGLCHGLEQGLEAARQLRGDKNKLFVFVGEGAEKDRLKELARQWQLDNVQFIDQQPRARVPLFYRACDIGLVTLRGASLFHEVLPSKLFEYLGMEKPVVLNVDGEARKLVESAGAGLFAPSGDVPSLVRAIQRLSEDRETLRKMGQSGRRYVLEHYDRTVLARRYLTVLDSVCRASDASTVWEAAQS